MKEKTSVTLSRDVLAEIDRLAGPKSSRSAIIEHILRQYLAQRTRQEIHARDLEKINDAADELNAGAADVLDYQVLED